MSLGFQFRTQSHMVLDNAVMDDHDLVAGHVRMGIALRHTAMGSPARMAKSRLPVERGFAHYFGQVAKFANGPVHLEHTTRLSDDPRTVIAPVFEPLEGIQNGFGTGF